MKPDLDAIRARCEAAQVIFERNSVVAPCVYDDIPALLAYIDQLERDVLDERATFQSCNRARMHCERENAVLRVREKYAVGEAEWAQRIETLEHMLGEERENVDTLRARVAELEAHIVTLEAMKP